MDLCNFGCGNQASYVFKNGKNCCSEFVVQCPEVRRKNSLKIKGKQYCYKSKVTYLNKNYKYYCIYCGKPLINKFNKNVHEIVCSMNPKNVKFCYCGNIILNKTSRTCSYYCSNKIFKNQKKKKDLSIDKHRDIAFRYHRKQCIICNEKNIVEVHHYDNNHYNNNPINFIPLCPTHHKYVHSKYKILIQDKINIYYKNFKRIFDHWIRHNSNFIVED